MKRPKLIKFSKKIPVSDDRTVRRWRRWRDWARRFSARCGRRPRRRLAADRVFLDAVRPAVTQRFEQAIAHFHRHFGPRIRLSIRPVLRRIFPGSPIAAETPVPQPTVWRKSARAAAEFLPQEGQAPQTTPGAPREDRKSRAAPPGDRLAGRPSPLERIFMRAGRRELTEYTAVAATVSSRLLRRRISRVEQTVERALRKTRRVEERALVSEVGSVRVHPKPEPAAVPSPVPASPLATMTPQRFGMAGHRWDSAPPGISIDALTDQVMRRVDRRLTAWRERTGRV